MIHNDCFVVFQFNPAAMSGGSHPSVINHCKNSGVWRCREVSKTGHKVSNTGKNCTKKLKEDIKVINRTASLGRAVVSFNYIGKCHGENT